MSGEGSPVCLICNASMGVSSRNNCPIFQTNVTASDQPVSNILSVILGQEIQKEVIHSDVICKKCFKLCNEVDDLQERITEIKMELNTFYQKTLRKIGDSPEEDEPASKSLYATSNKDKDTVTLIKKAPIKRVRKSTPDNGAPTEAQKNVKSDKDEESRDNEGGEEDDSDYSPLSLKKLDDGQEILNKDEILKKMKVELEEEDDDEDEEDDDDADENAEEQAVFSKKKIPKPKVADDFNHIIPQMIISREGKIYTCLLCSAEEKVQGESKVMIAHMKTMHNIKLFICDLCGVEFLKRNELLEHVNEHTGNEDGEYECEVCHRVFTNLRLYRVHKRMHFPQQKNHVCDSCGKAFLSRNMLEEHMNTHTGARPYKCNECGKDFASKYSLRAHEKTHLDKARPYKCTHCTKTFVTEASVAQHEKTHNAPRNFACNTCGKSFSSSRNLEVHCVIHTGFKPFVCRICNKAFARKAEIRDHERTHTGEKPYQCEFCGATFGQRSNLQSHKRATHYDDKRYQCIECGKAFKRRRLLDYHIKAAHTGERPYKCQLCSATFIYPEHFKKHRRIHTGEKPYACEVCGKAFNSRDNRNAHRFVHSDKKPYECLVCGLGFMRKPQLYNHMQSQGHINDTIVVNQPRLTTDDDLIAQEEQESRMEMVVEPQEQVLEEDAEGGDTKMYIRELKEHVIIQTKTEEEMGGENQYGEEVEHLIIDGQVQFADGEALEIDGTTAIAGVEGQHSLVIPASRHGGEYTVEGAEGNATVQTADGTLQLVISLPGDSDSNQQPWFNIVQQE